MWALWPWWLVWLMPLLQHHNRLFVYCESLEEFIGDDPLFDFLKVEDDELLYNMMDPRALVAKVGPLMNETINFEPGELTEDEINGALQHLHDELESLYKKLYGVAKFLVYVTDDELISMADKFIKSNGEHLTIESSHPHRSFGFSNGISGIIVSQSSKQDGEDDRDDQDESLDAVTDSLSLDDEVSYWDPDLQSQDLASLFIGGSDDENAVGVADISILSGFRIIKKIKKKIKRLKLKFALLLKLIKLKKIVSLKKHKLCIKIMLLIEKIKRTLLLIKALILKKIKYLITTFPFDVLWKIKLIIRLTVKVVDDIIWSAEIVTLAAILKIAQLVKKSVMLPAEVVGYFKLLLLEKLSTLGVIPDRDQEYSDYLTYDYELNEEIFKGSDTEPETANDETETDLSYYEDNGIEYVKVNSSVPDELDELFDAAFTTEEFKEFLNKHDLFNLDFVFTDEQELEREFSQSQQLLKRAIEDMLNEFDITSTDLGYETNNSIEYEESSYGEKHTDDEMFKVHITPLNISVNSSISEILVNPDMTVFRTIQGFSSIATSLTQPVTWVIILSVSIPLYFMIYHV